MSMKLRKCASKLEATCRRMIHRGHTRSSPIQEYLWSRCGLSALLLCLLTSGSAWSDPVTRYVWKDSPSPSGSYTNWDTAAHDIQTAIDATLTGDEVIVRAGIYANGGTAVSGLTNRVYITKAITVRSENNDPENTIIKGAWDPVFTNGPAAVRAAYLGSSSAKLIGFTLTNGATLTYIQTYNYTQLCGGGVFAVASATVSNCVIAGNVAHGLWEYGGAGAYGGTYYNCRFIGNRFVQKEGYPYGGGVSHGTLYNCELIGNTALSGGGAWCGILYGCLISNNVASSALGTDQYGTSGGVGGMNADNRIYVYDSMIVSNRADRGGGAGRYSVLDNCDIVANETPITPGQQGFGGGVYDLSTFSSVANCRIIGNRSNNGGGMYGGYATNTVFAHNYTIHYGGGAFNVNLVNCLLYGNRARSDTGGGGAYGNKSLSLASSTFIGNTPDGVRVEGASAVLTIENSIIYGNEIDNWKEKSGVLSFDHCCTTPAKAGWDVSNITIDPRFVSAGSGFGLEHIPGEYQLGPMSPARNVGVNRPWMTGAIDLDGNPRLDKMVGTVDMGCFEYVYQGTQLIVR